MLDLGDIMARDGRLSKALRKYMQAIDADMENVDSKSDAFRLAREAMLLAMANPRKDGVAQKQQSGDREPSLFVDDDGSE